MREISSGRRDADDANIGRAEVEAADEEPGRESSVPSEGTAIEAPCLVIKASRRADFSSSSLRVSTATRIALIDERKSRQRSTTQCTSGETLKPSNSPKVNFFPFSKRSLRFTILSRSFWKIRNVSVEYEVVLHISSLCLSSKTQSNGKKRTSTFQWLALLIQ